jgi:hypothetical protein
MADVLVLGSAHAPNGKPAATVPVVLRLGSVGALPGVVHP